MCTGADRNVVRGRRWGWGLLDAELGEELEGGTHAHERVLQTQTFNAADRMTHGVGGSYTT